MIALFCGIVLFGAALLRVKLPRKSDRWLMWLAWATLLFLLLGNVLGSWEVVPITAETMGPHYPPQRPFE